MTNHEPLTPEQAQSLAVAIMFHHPDIRWYDGFKDENSYQYECQLGARLSEEYGLEPGIWCIFYGKHGEMPSFDFLRRNETSYGYVKIGEHAAAA